ncbi:MAG: FAD binding domain-containing protein [Patulibacter sp.]
MDLNTVEALLAPTGRDAVDAFTDGDAWLAGGSVLFSAPNPHLRRLIDLRAFDWPPLTITPAGLEIAATCTIAELDAYAASGAQAPGPGCATDPLPWPALAVVPPCCRALRGSFKIWNVATVGGNLCTALPAGPMTSLMAGLAGRCEIWQPGGATRWAAVDEVVIGDGVCALAPGELLRAITLPREVLRGRAAMRQASLTELGRSAALLIARDAPHAFTLTITASVPRAVTLTFAAARPSAAELDDAILARLSREDYFDDLHGTPRWREQLTRRLARELLDQLGSAAGPAAAGGEPGR